MSPKHIKGFFNDSFDNIELVKLYSLAGGSPKYLSLVERYTSFEEAFNNLLLDTSSPIYSEAKILLQDEVTSPNVCWSLLQYIGEGATRITELAAKIKLPANQLTRYIDLLKDLQLINREVPVLEKMPHKSKKGLYRIIDPFFKLWFSIVYPYESFIEFEEVFLTKVKDRLNLLLEKHFAECFEDLSRNYTQGRMSQFECIKVGRQWDRNYEIDVAAVNENNELTVIGECKWSNSKIGVSIYDELNTKISENRLPVAENCRILFFSKSGFTDDLLKKANSHRNLVLIDIDQLF